MQHVYYTYEAFVKDHRKLSKHSSGATRQAETNSAWRKAKAEGRCEAELVLLKAKVKLQKSKQSGFFATFAKNFLEKAV